MPETMPNILNEQFYLFLSKCVNAHIQSFHKGEYIQAFNSKKKEIGIVKNGQITIYKADIDGNTFIFEKLMRDNIFSRSFIMHNEDDLFIITDEDTEIIFFDYNYLLKGCNELCPYHKMIVNQIFDLVLDYTSKINLKMDILTKKSIQEKLFTYFNYYFTHKITEGKNLLLYLFNCNCVIFYFTNWTSICFFFNFSYNISDS